MNFVTTRPLPLLGTPSIELITPTSATALEAARSIFRDYAQALGIDLGFQHFEEELRDLPGDYAQPRGVLLLALVEADAKLPTPTEASAIAAAPHSTLTGPDGRLMQVAGCGALRPFIDDSDHANAAEMKRLYVRPAFRRLGLGRQIAEALLDAARTGGYSCVLLDTLDEMESARALYEDLGFAEVPPYYHNPIAGAHYLKADLF